MFYFQLKHYKFALPTLSFSLFFLAYLFREFYYNTNTKATIFTEKITQKYT